MATVRHEDLLTWITICRVGEDVTDGIRQLVRDVPAHGDWIRLKGSEIRLTVLKREFVEDEGIIVWVS